VKNRTRQAKKQDDACLQREKPNKASKKARRCMPETENNKSGKQNYMPGAKNWESGKQKGNKLLA
jgi:hypothetical protein